MTNTNNTIDLGFSYFRSTRFPEEFTCYISTTEPDGDNATGFYGAEGSNVLDFNGDFKIDFISGGFSFTRKDFSRFEFTDNEGVYLHLKEPFRGATRIKCYIRVNIALSREMVEKYVR
jgi:hypothetical protein